MAKLKLSCKRINYRIMVALRRFQDLMRMLACQSPASSSANSAILTNTKSTQTPELRNSVARTSSRTYVPSPIHHQRTQNRTSTPKEHDRKSSQFMKTRNSNVCDNQRRDIYSSDEVLSKKHYQSTTSSPILTTNYARSRNVNKNIIINDHNSHLNSGKLSPGSSPIRQSNQNQDKTAIKKPDPNFVKNNDRALKILSRNSKVIASPIVKDHKFSRYTPLPAINHCENNLVVDKSSPEPVQRRNNRRLIRQLTYKVINPLFVKGPFDLASTEQNNFQSLNKTTSKKASRSVTPSPNSVNRSRTIVIKKNHQTVIQPPSTDRVVGSKKDHNGNNINSKSTIYPPSTLKNQSDKSKGHLSSSFKGINREKSLLVRKDLIEAAEKIKEGKPIIDSAFWVEF